MHLALAFYFNNWPNSPQWNEFKIVCILRSVVPFDQHSCPNENVLQEATFQGYIWLNVAG